MAEPEQQKIPTLAEQWSLQDNMDKSNQGVITVEETSGNGNFAGASSEVVAPEKTEEIPVPDGASSEIVVPEKTEETPVSDESTVAEENTEAPEQEETAVQDDAEEKPEIKLETAPADFRFPTTNQTRHCFTRYIEYHRCIAVKGDGASECDKFAKYYRSLCPSEWVERWNEQRENGTFPGPL